MTARATVVGSGPNGLLAAVALARAGLRVEVLEAADEPGGALRTAELTLPGYRHDIGAAVHPLARTSPAFRALGLERAIDWVTPEASFAHPLDDGPAAIAWRDMDRTIAELGPDGATWAAFVRPLNRHVDDLVSVTGSTLLRVPEHPLVAARFAARVAQLGTPVLRHSFRTAAARALWAGVAAHAPTSAPSLPGSAAGLLLAAHAHSTGWPLPRGGADRITDALLADLREHGGTVRTGVRVDDLSTLDWGTAREGAVLVLDTSPRLLETLPGLPARGRRAIARYQYGPGAAKVDLALSGPVPWIDPRVERAATVHLGGTQAEIERAERTVLAGGLPERPYVLAVQPTAVDPSRAPEGAAVLWAYVHVPAHSDFDPTDAVIAQVERFAPGFRDRILATHVTPARGRERGNPAQIGGDILSGALTLTQTVRRPFFSTHPWRTPVPGVYLASAATPPGPGVHGMNGWHAARTALEDHTGVRVTLADLFPDSDT